MLKEIDLSLSSLETMDGGKLGKVIGRHLSRMAADCYDRPGDDKPRKLTVQIDTVPKCDVHGNCETVEFKVKVKSSVPEHRSSPYEARIKPNGFAFNEDSPAHYPQQSLPFADE